MLSQFWLFHLFVILLFFPFTKSWKSECYTYFNIDLLGENYVITAELLLINIFVFFIEFT